MLLLLQVAGVLVAGAVVAALVFGGARPAAVRGAVVVLAVAFAYLAFWSHVWSIGKTFNDQRRQWAAESPAQAEVAGTPADAVLNASFAEWIRARLRRGETFYLLPSPTRDTAVVQWFTFRLLPNLSSKRPRDADVLVFYDTTPRAAGYGALAERLLSYQPKYAIARQHAH
jgi:hypothetical protein